MSMMRANRPNRKRSCKGDYRRNYKPGTREFRIANGLLRGHTQLQSCIDAGYPYDTAQQAAYRIIERPIVKAAVVQIGREYSRDNANDPDAGAYVRGFLMPLLDTADTLNTKQLVAELIDHIATLNRLKDYGFALRSQRAELDRRIAASKARPQPSSAPQVAPPPEPAAPQNAEKAPITALETSTTEDDEAAALNKQHEEREAALQAIVAERMRQWEEARRRRPASEALQKLARRLR